MRRVPGWLLAVAAPHDVGHECVEDGFVARAAIVPSGEGEHVLPGRELEARAEGVVFLPEVGPAFAGDTAEGPWVAGL